jgi:hypothetical protein
MLKYKVIRKVDQTSFHVASFSATGDAYTFCLACAERDAAYPGLEEHRIEYRGKVLHTFTSQTERENTK